MLLAGDDDDDKASTRLPLAPFLWWRWPLSAEECQQCHSVPDTENTAIGSPSPHCAMSALQVLRTESDIHHSGSAEGDFRMLIFLVSNISSWEMTPWPRNITAHCPAPDQTRVGGSMPHIAAAIAHQETRGSGPITAAGADQSQLTVLVR